MQGGPFRFVASGPKGATLLLSFVHHLIGTELTAHVAGAVVLVDPRLAPGLAGQLRADVQAANEHSDV
ncbi:MAG: hypothetical protein BA874_09725 [Desulfuromonadales bacterium C00003068]|nr:MAG: hypothetical protein BA874_09725 [Desulfuromonadales bacterium C00003068]